MKDYEIVVGLEVHAELNTKSKIYCNCRNAFGLEVNTQVCPVCMGMPGTLPTLNEKVVEYAIKMGHAMHCQINGVCKQDRKNLSGSAEGIPDFSSRSTALRKGLSGRYGRRTDEENWRNPYPYRRRCRKAAA